MQIKVQKAHLWKMSKYACLLVTQANVIAAAAIIIIGCWAGTDCCPLLALRLRLEPKLNQNQKAVEAATQPHCSHFSSRLICLLSVHWGGRQRQREKAQQSKVSSVARIVGKGKERKSKEGKERVFPLPIYSKWTTAAAAAAQWQDTLGPLTDGRRQGKARQGKLFLVDHSASVFNHQSNSTTTTTKKTTTTVLSSSSRLSLPAVFVRGTHLSSALASTREIWLRGED